MSDIYHITRERVVDIYDTRSIRNQLTDLKARKFLFYIKLKSSLITERRTFFMLEFKVIENLKPNKDLTDILKNFEYTVKLGQIKTILHTPTSNDTY